MRRPSWHPFLALLAALVALLSSARASAENGDAVTLDCAKLPCAAVLPGAVRFERAAGGEPYDVGYDAAGKVAGWVVVSTDVVDVKAYSGKPLVTLIGLRPDGVIAGAKVLHHSEPILLVGIPESALFHFVEWYAGKPATANIVVGSTDQPGALSVDVISGATVTSLAQNRTIVDASRALGKAVGVVHAGAEVPGHFVRSSERLSWKQMVDDGVLGHLVVTQEQMGQAPDPEPFIEMYFTVADAPQVGASLLGSHEYEWLTKRLKPGDHLVVVLGNGTSSFKGSGFVRGGIFDRVRLAQGLTSIVFTDKDYENLSEIDAAGAPDFKEMVAFIARGSRLDPGAAFDLEFLGSRYDRKSAFSRDFRHFRATLRLPRSVYVLDGPDPSTLIWRGAWHKDRLTAVALAAYMALVAGLFAARRFLTGDMERLKRLHLVTLAASFVFVGVVLRAQPSVTQVLTFVGSVVGHFRWGLFLSEPFLFLAWIFIAVVTLVWGRGVFCGWVCPYGALHELLFRLGQRLHLPTIELPERVHARLRWVRYVVLAVLVAVFLRSPVLGEKLAEIEPFKSTFFVHAWTRPVAYFVWWLLLLGVSLFWYRPFCRYLCPLGAALALPASLRASGPHRRRFCEHCKICTRGCEPRAIRDDGTIDPRECLSCMECEANYRDEAVCPPLVGIERLTRKAHGKLSEHDEERLAQLRGDAKDRSGWLGRRLPR
jgi:NosR/NirI family nitrous oxide reductase transcriptional regulator